MTLQIARNVADFGMDTITLAGPLEAKLHAVRAAGFTQIMLAARDIVGHPGGMDVAVQAVRDSGLRVTGFQVLRDFEGLSGHLHSYKVEIAKQMILMAHALGAKVLLACSSTSQHATGDVDAIARDLRKLSMLAIPYGLRVAYEGLSWGRHINEYHQSWDVVQRADCPNLGIGIDSYHIMAMQTPLDALDDVDPARIYLVQRRFHVERGSHRAGAHGHGAAFPGLSRRGRAFRGAHGAGAEAGCAGLPRRLQLRGLQRRLPAAPAAVRGAAGVGFGGVAGRGRAAPLGAAARADAAAAYLKRG